MHALFMLGTLALDPLMDKAGNCLGIAWSLALWAHHQPSTTCDLLSNHAMREATA